MFDILDTVLERARAKGAPDVEVFAERSTSRRWGCASSPAAPSVTPTPPT